MTDLSLTTCVCDDLQCRRRLGKSDRLSGYKSLFEEKLSLRLSDDEREGLIRYNTRKLYMAATRVGQRLVLSYSEELPDVLRKVMAHR